jgi:hypothetical protein
MFHPASDFRQYSARQIASAETLGIRGRRPLGVALAAMPTSSNGREWVSRRVRDQANART